MNELKELLDILEYRKNRLTDPPVVELTKRVCGKGIDFTLLDNDIETLRDAIKVMVMYGHDLEKTDPMRFKG